MSIKFERTAYPGTIDAFWRKEVQMLPGGFTPSQTIPVGEVVQRGAFVSVDFDNMKAALVKICQVVSGGTTSKPRVSKKNNIYAGDLLMKVGKTDTGVTVKSVDRSNADYDVIELSAAISGLAADDYLQEAVKDESQATATYGAAYTANAVLGADFEMRESGLPAFDVAYAAVVLKDVCTPFPASWLNGFCLAANPNILFVKQ